MAFHLKLLQPKELPEDNLTDAKFKPWTNHLINFLQQDVTNFQYLPGGKYEMWKAANEVDSNKRIVGLHADDDDKKVIQDGEESAVVKSGKEEKLLLTRNAQLGRMIQHIVSFVHYTEADDIDQSSTSLMWIFDYLRQHYNITPKGANFLKITDHSFKSGMQPQVFYKQFRSSFINNLRKKNEVMTHKGGKVLTEDEGLSPSFEDTIVLWALEKIDVRLPRRVRKDYEHRLTGNTYLIDLQVTIFQSIPSMLEDMNKQAELHALTTATNPETSLNAFRAKPSYSRGSSSRGGRGAGRGSERRAYSKLFCRVCHSAGRPAQTRLLYFSDQL